MATFENQLTALETVVEQLERGDLTLEQSVKLFEDGVRLSEACKRDLDAAEGRIEVLADKGSGKMVPRPLDVSNSEADPPEDIE